MKSHVKHGLKKVIISVSDTINDRIDDTPYGRPAAILCRVQSKKKLNISVISKEKGIIA